MITNENSDQHVADPEQRWTFDEGVTENFESMISASIPGYGEMRRWVDVLARGFLAKRQFARVTDIGASRGDAVAPLVRDRVAERFHLVEISGPMLEVLRARFESFDAVDITRADLSEQPELIYRFGKSDLVLSVLTLMFVPIENRQNLIQAVYDSLRGGGMLIVVEKTLGETSHAQKFLVDEYHAFKVRSGYTQENVERKRLSLKGSLVPTKPSWVEEVLRDAGFVDVTRFWQALQFVGWVAFKP